MHTNVPCRLTFANLLPPPRRHADVVPYVLHNELADLLFAGGPSESICLRSSALQLLPSINGWLPFPLPSVGRYQPALLFLHKPQTHAFIKTVKLVGVLQATSFVLTNTVHHLQRADQLERTACCPHMWRDVLSALPGAVSLHFVVRGGQLYGSVRKPSW